jgi:hypothetical protein
LAPFTSTRTIEGHTYPARLIAFVLSTGQRTSSWAIGISASTN